MSPRDAFKVGFLARCTEAGLTPEEILGAVKSARDKAAGLFDAAANAAGSIGSTVAHYGIPLALAAPPVIGGMAGYGLSKMTDVDESDINDIKDREVIDTLKHEARNLRRTKALRDYGQARQVGGSRMIR